MTEATKEPARGKREGSGFLVPIAIVIAGLLIAGAVLVRESSLLGDLLGRKKTQEEPVAEDLGEGEVAGEEIQKELATTIGNFSIFEDRQVCEEDGKPVVYYFGSESCPHCRWEEPLVTEVAAQFGDLIAFHNNMDSQEDMEVMTSYRDFNPGYIPFLVVGCRYARTGSGEQSGEEAEKGDLTALICKLTDGEPGEVCEAVEDLTMQIAN